jgi:hypothetical protein
MPSPPLLGRLIRHGGGIIIPCCGLARRGSGERRPPIYLHIYMDYLHRLDSGRGQVDPGKRWAGVGLETGALFLGAPFPGVVKKSEAVGGCGCGCRENNQPISLSTRRWPSPERTRNSPSSQPLTIPSRRVTAGVVGPPTPATLPFTAEQRMGSREGGGRWADGQRGPPARFTIARRRATATRAPAPSSQWRSVSALPALSKARPHRRVL